MKKLTLLLAAAFGCTISALAQGSPLGGPSCPNGYDMMSAYGYSGATETFTVPAGVTSIHISAWAPRGGYGVSNGTSTPAGGAGGYLQGYLSVTPGEVLYLTIGQVGQDAVANGNTNANGAFNGGGSGGYSAAGGAGATDIRRGGTSLTNRILVAGGGGGAGALGCGLGGSSIPNITTPLGGDGGSAGNNGTTGQNVSYNGETITGGNGGQIGASAAAGIGCNSFPGNPGNISGTGGNGPTFNACLPNGRAANGGGGGGGYVQGGGGGSGAVGTPNCSTNYSSGGGGGAGGSNYLSSDFTNTTTSSTLTSQGGIIICYPNPVQSADQPTISGPASICSGDNSLQTYSIASGNLNANANWVWYVSGIQVGTGTSVQLTTSMTISVRGEGGSAAPGAYGTFTPNIVTGPTANIVLTMPTVCGLSTGVLSAASSTNVDTYNWADGFGVALGNADNITGLAPNRSYFLTVTSANGCTASAVAATNNSTPLADAVISFTSSPLNLEVTNQSYSTYQWLLDGNIINGAVNSSYVPTQNGVYSVAVSDAGCMANSNGVTVTGVSTTTLAEATFTMSPNPTSGILVLDNLNIGANFRLVNSLGQIVKSFVANNTQMTIDLSAQPAGTYFLQSEGKAVVVVKQ